VEGAAPLLISAASGFIVSVVVVAASLAYARKRGLLDQPGQRRSHTVPTPRGGGIGIVAAVLVVAIPAVAFLPEAEPITTVVVLALALLAVAAVGWRDDHKPLPVLPRIGVHLLASLAVAGVLLAPAAPTDAQRWAWLVPVAIVFAGSINAHNFMDGIDALLGLQALFVLVGYALLAAARGEPALVAASAASAAACFGFLLFNRPPARIFMGDAGSGMLGLLIAAFAGLLVQRSFDLLWPCAILSSAFLVDAGLTLLARILAGKRWYTAHREHLYQWMARAGFNHARTDAMYLLWNLIIAAPVAWAALHWPASAPLLCAAVYVFAGGVWCAGKRACLVAVRSTPRAA
jgi:UDP-N-acetylmuramyl pentapeptide phosphotransferase/UDP-N-acetylglucosamine-1-phosphate transferase